MPQQYGDASLGLVMAQAWGKGAQVKYLSIICFIAGCLLFGQFVIDDAFITYRYGYNFVNYGVWNWNSDGNKVEAYTNFSYAVLSIIPAYFGWSALWFFKAMGLGWLGLFIWRARVAAGELREWATLFICANPYVYVNFFSGLETGLFMVLVLESFIQTRKAMTWKN